MDRVVGEIGIGNMTLHTVDGGGAGERTATTHPHHVTELIGRAGFADQTPIDAPAIGGKLCGHLAHTINGITLLIGRSEEYTSDLQSLMLISYTAFFLKKH